MNGLAVRRRRVERRGRGDDTEGNMGEAEEGKEKEEEK